MPSLSTKITLLETAYLSEWIDLTVLQIALLREKFFRFTLLQ